MMLKTNIIKSNADNDICHLSDPLAVHHKLNGSCFPPYWLRRYYHGEFNFPGELKISS